MSKTDWNFPYIIDTIVPCADCGFQGTLEQTLAHECPDDEDE